MVISQQASEHVALFVMLEEGYEEMSKAGVFWGILCVYPVPRKIYTLVESQSFGLGFSILGQPFLSVLFASEESTTIVQEQSLRPMKYQA